MIVANISTFVGQCADAEHYYCNYEKCDNYNIKMYCGLGTNLDFELKRMITDSEAEYLNKKDTCSSWREGMRTSRFDTIEQIHNTIKKLFPGEDIITYYEGEIFKEMLLIKDGVDIGRNYFGEVWNDTPTSCYADLLPPLVQIKVKCEECGHEFQLKDVSYEREWGDRKLIEFFTYREINRCCKYMDLKWNVVL